MSLSNRLQSVAVRGCVIATLAIASASYAQDNREQKPETSPAQQTQERAKPSIPITITAPVRVEREKEVEPDWDKLKCGEAKSHDEADLCEQRRMAKAAEDSVLLNKIQIGIGVLGLLALLITLRLTRRSTDAAVAAATTADKTIFEIEAPFLYPEIVRHTIGEDFSPFDISDPADPPLKPVSPIIHYRITNYGKAPAIFHFYAIHARVLPKYHSLPTVEKYSHARFPVVRPEATFPADRGDTLVIQIEPPLNRHAIAAIKDGSSEIILFGEFGFAGVQGAAYIQTFAFSYSYENGRFYSWALNTTNVDVSTPMPCSRSGSGIFGNNTFELRSKALGA
jgi:hypothetical protein